MKTTKELNANHLAICCCFHCGGFKVQLGQVYKSSNGTLVVVRMLYKNGALKKVAWSDEGGVLVKKIRGDYDIVVESSGLQPLDMVEGMSEVSFLADYTLEKK